MKMSITLIESSASAKSTKYGTETIEILTEQWVNVRYGTPEAPIDDLLVQVPAGKKWTFTYTVYIEERDA